MTVYVDDMFKSPMGQFRRMKMSHMFADKIDELHEMAANIGVAHKWYQGPPKTSFSHYDICIAMRNKAIALGAVEVTMREMAAMQRRLRVEGKMGKPEHALKWFMNYNKEK